MPSQFMSSYLSECVQIALRLERESDTISSSSSTFCRSACRIAPSSALEFEIVISLWLTNLRDIFLLLLSSYQTPMPADAFSHHFRIVEPSVLILEILLICSICCTILAGFFGLACASLSFDLCPGVLPRILMLPNRQCLDLVSGLYRTFVVNGSAFLYFSILLLVCHKSCF